VKVVVLVGASSGIGAELALQYAQQHSKYPVGLVLAARRMDRLEEVAAKCRESGVTEVLCVATDVTQEDSVKHLMEETVSKFGTMDVMYYIVGQAMHVKFEDITDLDAVARQIMNVNFHGAVSATYYALPHLRSSKGQIVAVSSIAGEISPPYLTFYAAAKHAMHGFFESLRNEQPGITVTIVCPGYVATEIDDKKLVGDGSVQSVELNVDKGKYMPAAKAAKLIIEAANKKKKKYHLTSAGAVGTTMHGLFPDFINSAVRKEMQNLNKDE